MEHTAKRTSADRLLIVEDESLVALAIRRSLERLGYEITGSASSAEEALRLTDSTSPDLILMDIHLKGATDGIEVAEHIRQTHRIPVVYLTAHSDEKTLQRAKKTGPFGYIVKPFDEKALHSTVEVALCKAKMHAELFRTKQKLETILRSLREAVIVVDLKGQIQYFNPAAERLFAAQARDVVNSNVMRTLRFRSTDGAREAELPISKIVMDGEEELRAEMNVVRGDGVTVPVELVLAGYRSERGTIVGLVITIRRKVRGCSEN